MSEKSQEDKQRIFSAIGFAWELGYTIAIPIVFFALVGRFADKIFGTSPLMLLGGIILSILVTSWLVWHKARRFL